MPIKVNISLSSGGRFKPVSSHTFHEKLITIGRDKDCTLTLEDTQKHVSRMHVELQEAEGTYWLKVVSKVNPVIVNGKRYGYENRIVLAPGDQITVGLYKLEIAEAELPRPVPRPEPPKHPESVEDITYVARPGTFPGVHKAPVVPPQALLSEEATFVPPPKAPTPQPPATPPAAEQAEEATYVRPATLPPPDSPAPPEPIKVAPPVSAHETDSADDEVTYIRPVSARPSRPGTPADPVTPEDEFSEDMTHIRRPAAAPVRSDLAKTPVKPAPVDLGLDIDLDAFGGAQAEGAVAELGPAVHDPIESQIEFSEDATYVRRPAPVPAATAAPPIAPVIGDRSVEAFLQGAGLSHLQVPDPEKFMRETGVMVRAAVEGMMMLLLAREDARRQLGAEPETGGGDNPLKSMEDPAEVIAFLFDPKRPAIADADPVQAFADACGDLRAHQVALLASMRAAVASALEALDPKKIEREHGVSLGGLNLTRKSKLWESSVAHYETLARETETDFNKAFGSQILAAYQAHLQKSRGRR